MYAAKLRLGHVVGAVDRPWVPAVVSLVAATVYVIARLEVAAGGNIAMFVVAGKLYADVAHVPAGLPVHSGSGYDGQFYYRLALDPGDLRRTAFGIRFDTRSRVERIGYPALSWLFAGGRASLVPDSLVGVNIVALGALGLGGGLMARQAGSHALWGLSLSGYWGFLWSLGRDLTEITAAAFLVLGLYAFRRDHRVAAGLLLLGSVLSKETAVYPIAALGLVAAFGANHRTGTRRFLDPAWVIPAVGFLAWQGVALAATGVIPILTSGGSNLGVPFLGLARAMDHYARIASSTAGLLWWSELVILVAVAAAAALALRGSPAPLHERIAWAGAALLAASVATGIWLGDVGFRSLDTLFLFSWIVLLGTDRRVMRSLAGVSAAMWCVVCVELIRFI